MTICANRLPGLPSYGPGRVLVVVAIASLALIVACQPADPAAAFIAHQDSLPPGERVADWEETKRRMLRTAPSIGESAPDFVLATPDGARSIRMADLCRSRPLVLVFGSFT